MRRRRWFLLACVGAIACGNIVGVQGSSDGPDAGPSDAAAPTDGSAPTDGGSVDLPDTAPPISCATFFDASVVTGADRARCLDFDLTAIAAGPKLGFDQIESDEANDGYTLGESPLAGGNRAFVLTKDYRSGVLADLVLKPSGYGVTFELDLAVDEISPDTSAMIASLRFGDDPDDGGSPSPDCPRRAGLFIRSAPGGVVFGTRARANTDVDIDAGDAGLDVFNADFHQTTHLSFRIDSVPTGTSDSPQIFPVFIKFRVGRNGSTYQYNVPAHCFTHLYAEVGSTSLTSTSMTDPALISARFDNVTYRNE